ncbi:MAG: 6,7-dimethyl-8-ribityllumazine synthase [Candidatus Midichloriaceae bacterium]|jgi:6,7-dimethyl-8-ribityllumazine synthase
MTKILISIANYYKDISDVMLDTVISEITKNDMVYDLVKVPGAFELASSINIALENYDYAGVVVLGCIIKGETDHFTLISKECSRAIQDISIYYSVPLGFGVITANNMEQAIARSKKYGIKAVNTCLEMIKVKERFTSYGDGKVRRFN